MAKNFVILKPHNYPTIQPEFENLLPSRTEVQTALLEKMLIEDGGNREPIVIWGEPNILVGGHHRFRICVRHGLEIRAEYQDFDSEDEAIEWMVEDQLAKRNLTDEERAYFIGKQYLQKKKTHGGDRKADQDSTSESCSTNTAEIVAKANKVSTGTVHTDAKFAAAVDAHEKKKPGSKDRILRGEAGPKKKVIETAPILCKRCQNQGAAKNCRWCAEEAAERAAAKKAKKPDAEVFIDHRKLPVAPQVESEDQEQLTSAAKGGGHPFAELRESVSALSRDITKAMKDHGEDSRRLHEYFSHCGLCDHDPKKNGNGSFIPLRGVAKLMELAGQGGKELTQQKVTREYGLACGGIAWIPPLTKRRRDAKKART